MAPGASATTSSFALVLAAIFITSAIGSTGAESGSQEDTTVLLQGEIVQAKASEQAKRRLAATDDKPRAAASPACVASGKDSVCQSCDAGEPLVKTVEVSDEESPTPVQEKTEPAELPGAVGLTEASAIPSDNLKADAEVPSFVLRSFLKLLIFLLFLDGLKRWFQEGTSFSQPKESPADLTGDDGKAAAAAFTRAALLGDAGEGEALLENVVSVDEADVWGSSILHAAAKGGSARLVSLLLQRGAKVDQLDAWDETPLHLAARAGFTEACELLLDAGAVLESRNMQDRAALEIAATEGKEAVCALLLARGASVPENGGPAFLQEMVRECRSDDVATGNRVPEPELLADQGEEDIRDYGRDGFEHNSFSKVFE